MNTDENIRSIDQDGFNIKYQEDLKRYYDKDDSIKKFLVKKYSMIYVS